jgi:ATP-dependent protease ClpP protease subunit
MDRHGFSIKAKSKDVADVAIFGDIGFSYTASDFQKALAAVGKVSTINLSINSPGGEVFQGFQIYNMLSRHPAKIVVTVDGLAASMASVIAMAGDQIIMPENAMMMIHNPVGMAFGEADQIESFSKALRDMGANITAAYVKRTGLSESRVSDMMDKETWLTADEAVKNKFADVVEEPVKMAARASYNLSRFHNVPESFGANVEDDDMEDHIKQVCALAGKADLADGFIKDKKSLADVLTALDTAKKEDERKAAAAATAKAAEDAKKKEAEGKAPTAAEIRAQVVAEHQEVRALCKLAGFPDKADEFIAANKKASEVVALLETAKAEKSKTETRGREVNPRNARPGEQPVALDTGKIWANWNKPREKEKAA